MRTNKRLIQNERASNGLTRREINADLAAKDITFDPYAPIVDLETLHAGVKQAKAA